MGVVVGVMARKGSLVYSLLFRCCIKTVFGVVCQAQGGGHSPHI